MLQTIHDKLKGWVAGVVLGVIGMVLVFWGINWKLSGATYEAKVNGNEISANQVRQTYQQQLAQIERQSSVALDDGMRNEIKQRVLEQYVGSEALLTRADDLGYRVSDSELLAEMAKVPALQVDGKFDYDHALAVLKAQGRSPAEIEELFRRDAKLRPLLNARHHFISSAPFCLKKNSVLTPPHRGLPLIPSGPQKSKRFAPR